MTTVAFDGTTLAADRMMGDIYNVQKIFRVPEGYAAGCGDYDYIVEVVQWLRDGASMEDRPALPDKDREGSCAASVIVVKPTGEVEWLTWPFLRRTKITEKFIAFGSGEEYARGAMAMGAGAKRAVEIACRYDRHSGMGVDAVRVVKAKRK